MQNHLNRLFGGQRGTADATPFEDLSLEEQAEVIAEEKAERVKYHREHVRNGPARFRTITAGQQRRQAERDKAALQRKANRNHRRNYLKKQRAVSVLRGQLQAVGVLPYRTDAQPSLASRIAAHQWIAVRFGERDDHGHLVLTEGSVQKAVQTATDEYRRLTAPAAKA